MNDARQIANWFIIRARQDNDVLSIMTILKLTYIAHGWYLETRNAPLFGNRIEAWQYGPVILDVYHSFRSQGIEVNKTTTTVPSVSFNRSDESFLEEVYNVYGTMPPDSLSGLTHIPGGPWDIARKAGGYYALAACRI